MLLAVVYVPLRRALDEVAWQIRVRNSVRVMRFIAALAPALRASADIAEVSVCAEQPPVVTGRRRVDDEAFASAVRALLAEHPRVTLIPGKEWRVRFSLVPCSPATTSAPEEAAAPAPP